MVSERRSGLCPSEKELPEWRSGTFCHKNTSNFAYRLCPYCMVEKCGILTSCRNVATVSSS
jgi:hypothetical protein